MGTAGGEGLGRPGKRVAIVQSNYIPWKGYFDLIASVDEFVLYDDAQYTRRDWRNRNLIKTPNGPQWLSVPVRVKGRYLQLIREVEVADSGWAAAHWKAMVLNYARAPHFAEVAAVLEPLYMSGGYSRLSEVNRRFIDAITEYLRISTRVTDSSDYELPEGQTERLVAICVQAGATEYVSGPSARDYLANDLFEEQGIGVNWYDYAGYPEYPQLWGAFTHHVSIVDLLFNCGPEAGRFMREAIG